jgi:hypothetical protein
MHMIGHEAVGPNLDTGSAAPYRQQTAIGETILIAKENLLTPVTPLRHMMGSARRNNPRHSSHRERLALGRAQIN